MIDNDIIKAYKLCITCADDKCRRCPARDVTACTVGVETGILDIIERRDAEIEALIAGQETLQKYTVTARAEESKAFAEKVFERITEIYNKHIFGNNDLSDEEKEAIMDFSNDVTSGIDGLVKEMTEEPK